MSEVATSILANLIVGPLAFVGGILIVRYRNPLNALVFRQQEAMLGRRMAQKSAGRQQPWVLGVVGSGVMLMGVIMVSGAIVAIIRGGVLPGQLSGEEPVAPGSPAFAMMVPFVIVSMVTITAGFVLWRFRRRVYEFVDRRTRSARGVTEVNEFARQHRPFWIGLAGVVLCAIGVAVLVSGVVTVLGAAG